MSITSRCVVLRHALARPEGPRGKRSRLARSILRRECKYIFSKFFSQSAQKQLQSLCGYAIITKLLTRPCGQAVKTAPSHGAIPGSIPGKVTKQVKGEPVSIRRRIRLYRIFQDIEKAAGASCEAPAALPLFKVY